ncbi:transporter substrate-binding domain-containing protein [Thermoflavimicrobium dichotomicum]|uniref:Polar amino acid transport system substrate-binding protein n=1 Tax=Thermoflavimicrobium dichotomicum TaxID=46223 RepID=A0A1I3JXC4_9BACL|nr:transporter substrate-binding domain-containing protein [Thermoflavimicrobium dichotomicum]SFI64907.1 polar amino acid transport system substrate-binding protein [Thermoflavimicrobium dichotomicum]
MKRALMLLVTTFVAVALVLTSCTIKVDFGGQESAAEGKKLTVVTDAQFPPFEKLGTDGKIIGFDAELLEAVAKAAGVDVELKHVGWDQMFKEVDAGKADAAIAAISITQDRLAKYEFTDSYFVSKQLILVPVGSNVKTLEDLRGKDIGVLAGSTGATTVKKEFGEKYSKLEEYDDIPSAVKDLAAERLDAVVADSGVVKYFVQTLEETSVNKEENISSSQGQTRIVVKIGRMKIKAVEDPFFPPESYGIMVKKGKTEILQELNKGLKKVKEDGTYDRIYQKYFGKD